MNVPFTQHEFLEVFKSYNEGIWPVQALVSCLGFVLVLFTLRRRGASPAWVLPSLAGMWVVNGAVYHWIFFSNINPIARVFGAAFVVQALLFSIWAVRFKGKFEALADGRAKTGLLLTAYALVIYPIWGVLAGHGYPYSPMFGVAPCPTTIFTLGMLLMSQPHLSNWNFVNPNDA